MLRDGIPATRQRRTVRVDTPKCVRSRARQATVPTARSRPCAAATPRQRRLGLRFARWIHQPRRSAPYRLPVGSTADTCGPHLVNPASRAAEQTNFDRGLRARSEWRFADRRARELRVSVRALHTAENVRSSVARELPTWAVAQLRRRASTLQRKRPTSPHARAHEASPRGTRAGSTCLRRCRE